jgi:hypothetical protein
MLRRLIRKRAVSSYLSTNQPVWWSARLDLAILLSSLLFLILLPMLWVMKSVAPALPEFEREIRTTFGLSGVAIASVVVILWCIRAANSMYKHISPRMAHYPTVLTIIVSISVILLPLYVFLYTIIANPEELTSPVVWLQGAILLTLLPASIIAPLFYSVMRTSLGITLAYFCIGLVLFFIFIFAFLRVVKALPLAMPPCVNEEFTAICLFCVMFIFIGGFLSSGAFRSISLRKMAATLTLTSLPLLVFFLMVIVLVVIFSTFPEFYLGNLDIFENSTATRNSFFVLGYSAILWVMAEFFGRRIARLSLEPS